MLHKEHILYFRGVCQVCQYAFDDGFTLINEFQMKKLYLMLQLCHQIILTSDTFVSTIETPRIYLLSKPFSCLILLHIRKRIGNDLDLCINEELHIGYHVRFQVLPVATMNFKVFSDILSCSQIDVDIYLTTRQYIPEHSELHCVHRLLFWNS
jgi:hypothetical protein